MQRGVAEAMNDGAEGLDGVVAAKTRLSHIDGEQGRLTLAGYDVADVAPTCSFEAMAFLMAHDRLPNEAEEAALARSWAEQGSLDALTLRVLERAARAEAAPIDALRLAVATLGLEGEASPERIVGAMGVIVPIYERLRAGRGAKGAPSDAASLAGRVLEIRDGAPGSPEKVRALETYLNTVVDHGMNASTFTARVVVSTGSDRVSAVEAALGALKGPLHGGAPGPALRALLELRTAPGDLDANTREWVRRELAEGRRIMGFGHRVYRVRDPRADVLRAAARTLLAGSSLLEEAQVHERAVLETLAELKPGRPLETNVEFYTALLLHGLGFAPEAFTAVFALGRSVGWLAHVAEQHAEGKLLRPRARYVGATNRRFPEPFRAR